jgi:uncharacterized membrane protein
MSPCISARLCAIGNGVSRKSESLGRGKSMQKADSTRDSGRLPRQLWAGVVGFALAGFFDGILLHQILQWHHLLSLVPGIVDLRVQVLWDGYFHAFMYILAFIGLVGLWRTQGGTERAGPMPLLRPLLIGFGLWHVVDGLLSHWILGIHRVRLDDPLFWDLIWFFGFGIAPLLGGWLLTDRSDTPSRRRFTALTLVTVATLGAGSWALLRPPGALTAVVFSADATPRQILESLSAADASIVWTADSMTVLLVQAEPWKAVGLYGRGALFVGSAGLPGGCLSWTKTPNI